MSERAIAFDREGRAGARLEHSAIVSVHAAGEADGVHYIAQELIRGGRTLADFLKEVRSAPELPPDYYRQLAQLFIELAGALHEAHAAGVVHRDVKPRNILITPEGKPKISDFGLARITEEESLSGIGETAGTYAYMSPEQVTLKHMGIDHRTDVFSLGVVLYEALTFARPFQGDTTQRIVQKVLWEDPPHPRSVRSLIPVDLAVICGKAMEKQPRQRYSTMAEFAADLRRHLSNEAILAKPPGRLRGLVLWTRRHPAKSAASAVAAVAIVTISFLLLQNLRANRRLGATVQKLDAEIAAVKRLSAIQDYEDLIEEVDDLWPPHPRNIGSYREWMTRARTLAADLPAHHARLGELRALALHRAEEGRGSELRWSSPETEEGAHARWWQTNLTQLIDALEGLESGLLSAESISTEHGWSVPRRLSFAEKLEAGFAPGGEFEQAWSQALPAIRDAYPGLALKAQMGLVPLDADPDSGLWEFAHLMTGEPAERDPDGRLVLTERTGVVLVLIPSGSFWMGAQSFDPEGRNYDPQAGADEGPPMN